MYYVNGDYYDGEWLSNLKEGEGKYTFQNRDFYDGKWEKDKYHGFGIFYTAENAKI